MNYTDRLQREAEGWGSGPINWYPDYQAKCKELAEAKEEIKRLSTHPATEEGEDKWYTLEDASIEGNPCWICTSNLLGISVSADTPEQAVKEFAISVSVMIAHKENLTFKKEEGEDVRKEAIINKVKELLLFCELDGRVCEGYRTMDIIKELHGLLGHITLPSTQSVNYCAVACNKHEFVECKTSYTTSAGVTTTKTYQCRFCGFFSTSKDGYPETNPSGIDKEEELIKENKRLNILVNHFESLLVGDFKPEETKSNKL